ncbi:MAG: hypothetical protein QNJ51_01645 [Calothrix sp. MO_167.B12]|nr:hypothetical protein [Calothrix sp. MO_167.B12]
MMVSTVGAHCVRPKYFDYHILITHALNICVTYALIFTMPIRYINPFITNNFTNLMVYGLMIMFPEFKLCRWGLNYRVWAQAMGMITRMGARNAPLRVFYIGIGVKAITIIMFSRIQIHVAGG